MTDRIDLTQLRRRAESDDYKDFHPEIFRTGQINIDTDTLLALIDAVEAAQQLINELALMDDVETDYDRLRQALDRFDRT